MTHPAPDRDRSTDSRPARTRPARLTWAQVRAQWPLALVLLGLAVGLGLVWFERWRRGAVVLGGVAICAAVLRFWLSDERARLMKVRSKRFDVCFYLGLGAVILYLASSIDALGTG